MYEKDFKHHLGGHDGFANGNSGICFDFRYHKQHCAGKPDNLGKTQEFVWRWLNGR